MTESFEVLVAVDPGIKTLGYAEFRGGRLVDVGLSRAKGTLGECALAHVARVPDPPGARRVCERMTTRGRKMRFAHQDLMDVSVVAGAMRAHTYYAPSDWKGAVPKEIHQPRILAALDDEEKAMVERVKPAKLRHNAIDAVGIGLYALGRMDPLCPSPNPITSTPSTDTTSPSSSPRGNRSRPASKRGRAAPRRKKIGGRPKPLTPSPF